MLLEASAVSLILTLFPSLPSKKGPIRQSIPPYVLARGEKAKAAYRRALEIGKTTDKRVRVLLIGQDRVGKTSVGRSLKGEEFKKDESSTEGVQMDIALKRVGAKPWKNSTEEQQITAFDHKCALFISNDLSTKLPERGFEGQAPIKVVPKGMEERMPGVMADKIELTKHGMFSCFIEVQV